MYGKTFAFKLEVVIRKTIFMVACLYTYVQCWSTKPYILFKEKIHNNIEQKYISRNSFYSNFYQVKK